MASAAVALILREAEGTGVEVLMIRRGDRDGDPWSGHMGFPGGRMERTDASPLATAIRETIEEVSVDLALEATLLGRLAEIQARSRRGLVPLSIQPFVFAVHRPIRPRTSSEAIECLWIPLNYFRVAANRSTMSHVVEGAVRNLPCYHYQERVVWGLSLVMLDELVGLVSPKSTG